jgi:mevalonate kinase
MTSPSNEGRGHASGKVILLGEHTVVYGAPALAAGLERGARATARAINDASAARDASEATNMSAQSALQIGGRSIAADASSEDDLARAFAALLAEGAPSPALRVEAASDLPPGGGLGSSAALGVAIARAVEDLAGRGDAAVLARAAAWERVFHGNPSGIDTAAAFTGGLLRFSRESGVTRLEARAPLWLCVGWSGESSSTRSMVEGVARLRARRPELVDRSISGAAALVENAALAMKAGDTESLGKLMDLAQMILAGLMLSTEAIEHMCGLARGAGALGAKLTGAGGGGSVIALVRPTNDGRPPTEAASAILAAWQAAGFTGFLTRAGEGRALPEETQSP